MASVNKKANKRSCGGKARVTYVYENDKLVYSEIDRKDQEVVQGFLKEGYYLVQATKAIVKTSERLRAYKDPDRCRLTIKRKPGAPVLETMDMRIITWECTADTTKRKARMTEKERHPVVGKQMNIKASYVNTFQLRPYVEAEYKPHVQRLLDLHSIAAIQRYEKRCNTANVVEFSPPLVLLYGPKYRYKICMRTAHSYILTGEPTVIITFYCRVYETKYRHCSENIPSYFSESAPPTRKKTQPALRSYIEASQDESDIDDYNDVGTDGGKEYIYKKRQAARNAGSVPVQEMRKSAKSGAKEHLQENDDDTELSS